MRPTSPSTRQRLLSRLAAGCVLLMLVVTTASAWLRLAQPRPGCDEWPHCRLAAEAGPVAAPADPAATTGLLAATRGTHRVAASAVLVLVLALLALATRPPRDPAAIAHGLALLALALALAALGIAAPRSQAAAVLLGNLGGGLLTAFPNAAALRSALDRLDVLATLEILPTEITAGDEMVMLREGTGGAAGTAEYGTTTGRARRVGWFDGVLARYTARLNGVTSVALTRLDSLSALESIKVCVAYELDDQRITTLPPTVNAMERAKPIYEELPGWGQDVTHVRHLGDLPTEARQYVRRIEQVLGVPVDMISVGPERHQAIVTRDVFGASIEP